MNTLFFDLKLVFRNIAYRNSRRLKSKRLKNKILILKLQNPNKKLLSLLLLEF